MTDSDIQKSEAQGESKPPAESPLAPKPPAATRQPLDAFVRKVEVRSNVRVRMESAAFLRKAFGFSLLMTFGAIFFQGFQLWGFHLSEPFLNWLGGATVGQVGGLFVMVLRQK